MGYCGTAQGAYIGEEAQYGHKQIRCGGMLGKVWGGMLGWGFGGMLG